MVRLPCARGPRPALCGNQISDALRPRIPIQVLLSPDELGTAILLHFSADVPAATTFVVEWALAADDWTPATPAGGVALPPF